MKNKTAQKVMISQTATYSSFKIVHKLIKIFVSIILLNFFLFISYSCKKEPPCVCGVEHPEENLPWLKNNIFLESNVTVYQYFFEYIEYVIMDEPPGGDNIKMVFNCEGDLLCTEGGIVPGANECNLPLNFWNSYEQNRVFIFKKESSVK